MAFDDVVLHESYVALPKLRRHTVLRVYPIQLEVRHIYFFDLETVFQQVTYPPGAAPSRRAFVYRDVKAGRSLLSQG